MRQRQTFSPAQCRAARGLLNWSQAELAERVRVQVEAVELFEGGDGDWSEEDLHKLGAVFYAMGVIAVRPALAGEGVRFNQTSAERGSASPWADPYGLASRSTTGTQDTMFDDAD